MNLEFFNVCQVRGLLIRTKRHNCNLFIAPPAFCFAINSTYAKQIVSEGIVFGVRFWRFGFSIVWALDDESFDSGTGRFIRDMRDEY